MVNYLRKSDLVVLVDKDGKRTGDYVPRDEAHTKGLMHEVVVSFAVRSPFHVNEIKEPWLVVQRSYEKEVYPGMMMPFVGEHSHPKDKSPLDAIVACWNEELKCTCGVHNRHKFVDLHCAGLFDSTKWVKKENYVNLEFTHFFLYLCPFPFDWLKADYHEIISKEGKNFDRVINDPLVRGLYSGVDLVADPNSILRSPLIKALCKTMEEHDPRNKVIMHNYLREHAKKIRRDLRDHGAQP